MTFARVSWPLFFLAALAACSGNLGSGQSTLPGMPQGNGTNVQQVANAAPTATPNSVSGVVTLGDTTAAQALPAVMGYFGTITFPKPSAAPSASPNPKASATPADPAAASAPIPLGITASTVEPDDVPHFSPLGKRRGKHDSGSRSPLLFITLLAPADVTLPNYPAISVDIPREIAAKHPDDTFALALYDPGTKEKIYHLAVAERDYSSPAPGSDPTPVPTPVPVATPMGLGNSGQLNAFTPPPLGSGLSASGLPPERVAFLPAASTLTLLSNRPAVFVLYAVPPQPSPSPSPSATASGSAAPSSAPSAASSAAPAASPVPVPAKS